MTSADPPNRPASFDPFNTDGDEIALIRAGAIAGFENHVITSRPDGTEFDINGHLHAAHARPGGVLIGAGQVLWAGDPRLLAGMMRHNLTRVIDLPDRLILPGLVNAHAHLELTAIGPQPYGGDFVGWVKMLRERMPSTASGLARAAARGATQAKAAGVVAVGDIARCDAVAEARREASLAGISFIEVLGMGPPWDDEALATIAHAKPADGLQPHAPYSAGPGVFDAACASGLPVSCHLAETLDEARFIDQGDGPFLELLQALGKWSPDFASHYGHGQSPVQWMEPYLRRVPWLLAHCNYVSDDDLALLAATDASVAYCPIASEYFGHHASGGDHRYRDMLDAGINVCLGTDSIVCQPAHEAQPLGILPQMRRLYQRDQTDPALLLEMATTHGRRALQLDDRLTRLAAAAFDPDDATDPLQQVLLRTDSVESLDCDALTPPKDSSP